MHLNIKEKCFYINALIFGANSSGICIFFLVQSTYFGIFHLVKNVLVNNKDTRIRKVNNKVKKKNTVAFNVASLLLT